MEDRDSIRTANDGEGLYTYESEHVMAVGQGVGHTTLSIEEITTEQSSFNYELSISRETEAVAGGLLVGAGLSFDFDYGYSNSVSSGTYVAVSIGDVNETNYADYIYKYGLMAYPKTAGSTEDDTYQAFTMVTCWVEPVSAD